MVSKYFSQIHGILESNGENYEDKYPEIRANNVFSISTLARGAASQVNWKLKGEKGQYPYESFIGHAFFLGRSVHEFIQNRMKEDCIREFPIDLIEQIDGDFIVGKIGGFKLLGHIDLLDWKEDYVLELKTTSLKTIPLCRLNEYVLQVGTYAKILSMEKNRPFRASVFVINGTLTEYPLTQEDIDKAFQVIMTRGRTVYETLKKEGKLDA